MSQADTSSADHEAIATAAAAPAPSQPADGDRIDGEVKWFDVKKGFGFIGGPEGEDVFVHFSAITGDGFRTLKDGEAVSYTLSRGDKGFHALDVRRTGAPADTAHAAHTADEGEPRPARKQPRQNAGGGFKSKPANKSGGRDKPRREVREGRDSRDQRDDRGDRPSRKPSIEALPHERDRSLVGAKPAAKSVGSSRADHGLPIDDDDDGYVG